MFWSFYRKNKNNRTQPVKTRYNAKTRTRAMRDCILSIV